MRAVRLLVVPALVLPFVLSTVILPSPAWAKVRSQGVKCYTLTGHWGGAWSLACNQPLITGTFGNVAQGFPSSTSTVVWSQTNNPAVPADHTTFTMGVTKARHDKCHSGSIEYIASGAVLPGSAGNTATPGVKGKVKAFVCVTMGGSLSLLGAGSAKPKAFKL